MSSDRLPFIDALRILAFGLLVLYHVGMYYVSWDWHLKSATLVPALEPLMRLSSPWRMSLLFLLSGVATGVLLGRPEFRLRERMARLLKPLLLGVLVIVPPQSYLEVVHKLAFDGSYAEFMVLYLSGHRGFCRAGDCLIVPTWNHLWFLPYLALYTALVGLAWRRWPGVGDGLRRAGSALVRRPVVLLLVPVLWLVAARLALLPRFAPTHALVDDPLLHAQYLPMFLIGLAWTRPGGPASAAAGAWPRLVAMRHVALVLLLLGWGLWLAMDGREVPLGSRALCVSVAQWAGVLAALGYAARHLATPRAWVRRLGEAVFPVYLVHQTILIVAAWYLAGWRLSPAVEAPLLAALTFVGGWGFYVAVRRVAWLRPWCGLAPQASAAEAASIDARRPV